MTETVLVAAPILHVPPRARTARTTYVPVPVRVDLRDLGDRDHAPGPELPCPSQRVIRTRILDGRLWRPVRLDDGTGKDPKKAVSPEEFRLWLAGDRSAERLDLRDAGRCFAGTPLVVRQPHQREQLRVRDDVPVPALGQVVVDHRDRAARMGKAYLDGCVAILSGVPHVRMRGPVAFVDLDVERRRVVRHPGAHTSYGAALNALPFGVGRREAQLAFETGRLSTRGTRPISDFPDEWAEGLFDGVDLDNDDDVDLFVDEGLRRVVETTTRVPRGEGPHSPERLALLHAWHDLSQAGLVDPRERVDVLTLVAAAAAASAGEPGWRGTVMRRVAAFAAEVALPRLAERAGLVPEDDAALSLVAP